MRQNLVALFNGYKSDPVGRGGCRDAGDVSGVVRLAVDLHLEVGADLERTLGLTPGGHPQKGAGGVTTDRVTHLHEDLTAMFRGELERHRLRPRGEGEALLQTRRNIALETPAIIIEGSILPPPVALVAVDFHLEPATRNRRSVRFQHHRIQRERRVERRPPAGKLLDPDIGRVRVDPHARRLCGRSAAAFEDPRRQGRGDRRRWVVELRFLPSEICLSIGVELAVEEVLGVDRKALHGVTECVIGIGLECHLGALKTNLGLAFETGCRCAEEVGRTETHLHLPIIGAEPILRKLETDLETVRHHRLDAQLVRREQGVAVVDIGDPDAGRVAEVGRESEGIVAVEAAPIQTLMYDLVARVADLQRQRVVIRETALVIANDGCQVHGVARSVDTTVGVDKRTGCGGGPGGAADLEPARTKGRVTKRERRALAIPPSLEVEAIRFLELCQTLAIGSAVFQGLILVGVEGQLDSIQRRRSLQVGGRHDQPIAGAFCDQTDIADHQRPPHEAVVVHVPVAARVLVVGIVLLVGAVVEHLVPVESE